MSDPKITNTEPHTLEEVPQNAQSSENLSLLPEVMTNLAKKWDSPPGMNKQGKFQNTYKSRPDGRWTLETTLGESIKFQFDDRSETVRLVDTRIGLSFAVPGNPEPLENDFASTPRREAGIRMQTLPLELAYEWITQGDAVSCAENFAAARAVRSPAIRPISPRLLRRAGAKSGVMGTYQLLQRAIESQDSQDSQAANTESVWTLSTGDGVAQLAVRFNNQKLDVYGWIAIAGGILGSLKFTKGANEPFAWAIWPESYWLQPSTPPVLRIDAHKFIAELQPQISTLNEQATKILRTMALIVESPYEPILEEDRATLRRIFLELPELTWKGLMHKIHNWHDLRGFVLATLAAMSVN